MLLRVERGGIEQGGAFPSVREARRSCGQTFRSLGEGVLLSTSGDANLFLCPLLTDTEALDLLKFRLWCLCASWKKLLAAIA